MVANTIEKYDMSYLLYLVQRISIILGNSSHFQFQLSLESLCVF